MNNRQLLKEFDSLPNDVEKWRWIRDHQETGIIIWLDDDETFGSIYSPGEIDGELVFNLDTRIGKKKITSLLEAFEIKHCIIG